MIQKQVSTLKTIVITGATSGIGLFTACQLASEGHHVIATSRSIERGNQLLTYYKQKFPFAERKIEIISCDLASFESIQQACQQIISQHESIDVLINNAGVWNFKYRESKNQIEETLAVNVLAPLLINHLLLDVLMKSSTPKSIFAASALHQGKVNFNNLEFKTNFNGFKAYRQSKLELILITRLLATQLARFNINVYCEHPGLVNTKLGRDANWFSNLFFKVFGISPKRGAETLIYLVNENSSNLISGEYYYKKEIKKTTYESYDMKVATTLLKALQTYLSQYIRVPSPIFQH